MFPQPFENLKPAHPRHPDIQQQKRCLALNRAGPPSLKTLDRLLPINRKLRNFPDPGPSQRPLDDEPIILVILRNQNIKPRIHLSPSCPPNLQRAAYWAWSLFGSPLKT